MRYVNKRLKKIMVMLIVCTIGLTFGGPITGVYAEAKKVCKNVEISASFTQKNNETINFIVKPVGLKEFKTMPYTQIWGNFGEGWFLIKDYNTNNSKINDTQFNWKYPLKTDSSADGKTLDKSVNEEYFRQLNNGHNSNGPDYAKSSDMLKVYIKYKEDEYQKDLLKTFYLGDMKEDVELITKEEKEGLSSGKVSQEILNFPIVVMGKSVELYVNDNNNSSDYVVQIIGENNKVVDKCEIDVQEKVVKWTPKESGTFYISVYDKSINKVVLQRKVYVNDLYNQYVELEGFGVNEDKDSNICLLLNLKNTNTKPALNPKTQRKVLFTISEPGVWSQTVKNVSYFNFNKNGVYTINEKLNDYKFGYGTYFLNASVKTLNSIEPEDSITKSYTKYPVDDNLENEIKIDFKTDKKGSSIEKVDNENFQGEYNVGVNFEVKVETKEDIYKGKYEFAYLLEDARGKRLLRNYVSDKAYINWKPADSGNYVFSIRVRKVEELGNLLPNSYEKEINYKIHLKNNIETKINEVKLNNSLCNDSTKEHTFTVKAHALNIIEVAANNQEKENKCAEEVNDQIMYKAYAVNKGLYYPLTDYTFSNKIPFYPQTTGQYKLIILVKDSKSGSQEDSWELKVNAQ